MQCEREKSRMVDKLVNNDDLNGVTFGELNKTCLSTLNVFPNKPEYVFSLK